MLHLAIALGASLFALANGAVITKRAPISSVPQSAWKQLNSSVNGRLGAEYPLGAYCYTTYEGKPNPHVNLAQCSQLALKQSDTTFEATFAQGYSYATWPMCIAKNQSCNTEGQLLTSIVKPLVGNCQQGAVPNYYVNATNAAHVQAVMAFIQKYNIPLVVKASGHDYKGRSAAPGSLMLWTYHIRVPLQVIQKFTPVGYSAPVGTAVTYGGGEYFENILKFADDNGGVVVGGTSRSVTAAGGYLQGGGHSPLAPVFGLAVDNCYQIAGVLANGTTFTATRQHNPDLFFALRGGGGGTFAVVTQAWTKFHQHPANGYQFALFLLTGLGDESAADLLKVLIGSAEQFAKDGWGGYAFPSVYGNHSSLVVFVNPVLNLTQAKTSMKPLTDFFAKYPVGNLPLSSITTYKSYYDIWHYILSNGDLMQSGGVTLSSRLIPVDNFRGAKNQSALFEAMYPITYAFGSINEAPLFICITTPYSYNVGSDANSSAVTPAWRNSLWHVIAQNTWDPNESQAQIQNEFKITHDIMQPLIGLTPGSGAYQNEADVYESDPAGAFWGQQNYQKLLTIKKQYDPKNILTCKDCIGWDASDERFSCYPQAPS